MIFYQDGLLFLYFTYLHGGFLTLGLTCTSPQLSAHGDAPLLTSTPAAEKVASRTDQSGMAVTPKELCSSTFPIFSRISPGEAQRSFPMDCLRPIVLGVRANARLTSSTRRHSRASPQPGPLRAGYLGSARVSASSRPRTRSPRPGVALPADSRVTCHPRASITGQRAGGGRRAWPQNCFESPIAVGISFTIFDLMQVGL